MIEILCECQRAELLSVASPAVLMGGVILGLIALRVIFEALRGVR